MENTKWMNLRTYKTYLTLEYIGIQLAIPRTYRTCAIWMQTGSCGLCEKIPGAVARNRIKTDNGSYGTPRLQEWYQVWTLQKPIQPSSMARTGDSIPGGQLRSQLTDITPTLIHHSPSWPLCFENDPMLPTWKSEYELPCMRRKHFWSTSGETTTQPSCEFNGGLSDQWQNYERR
jgi:hypothetical protein